MIDRNAAITKLNAVIEKGRDVAIGGLEAMREEFKMRKDYAVKPQRLDYVVGSDGLTQIVGNFSGGSSGFVLSDFAKGQLLDRAKLPARYVDTLVKAGMTDLVEENLRRTTREFASDGMMLRTVGSQAKAVLSPSYKRLDSVFLAEEFAEKALHAGLVPYKAEVTESRQYVSFIKPELVTLPDGDVVMLGEEFRSSDYGRGAAEINLSVIRLLCLNGATGADVFRQVHLGKRFDSTMFDETGVSMLSAKTLELDIATVRSAMGDLLLKAPAYLDAMQAALMTRVSEKLSVQAATLQMKKLGLGKGTVTEAVALYENEALPVEALPPAQNTWRFSNVLSLMANKATGDHAMDLRDAAWKVLLPDAIEPVAPASRMTVEVALA